MTQNIYKAVRLNDKANNYIKKRMRELNHKEFKKYFLYLLQKDNYTIDLDDV